MKMDSIDNIASKSDLKNNSQNQNSVKKLSKELYLRRYNINQALETESNLIIKDCGPKKSNISASDLILYKLKEITNNRFLEEEEKSKCQHYKKNNEIALERWKILAKALIKTNKNSTSINFLKKKNISTRKFTSFELIKPVQIENFEKFDGYWLLYATEILGITYKIKIHHLEQKLTLQDLIGFNNTGNICIWPSEEVLAYYSLSNINFFDGKDLLEVGGGMTCLAGVMVACHGKAKKVDLTDGNLTSIENVKRIIKKNNLNKDLVESFSLNWVNHRQLKKKYDVIFSSDCLFFDETRADLVETIWRSLRKNGVAFVMAPKRGNTLDSFIKLAEARGFYCNLRTYYDDVVWKQHMKFKEFKSEYNENLHYPLLLLLTKFNQKFSDF